VGSAALDIDFVYFNYKSYVIKIHLPNGKRLRPLWAQQRHTSDQHHYGEESALIRRGLTRPHKHDIGFCGNLSYSILNDKMTVQLGIRYDHRSH